MLRPMFIFLLAIVSNACGSGSLNSGNTPETIVNAKLSGIVGRALLGPVVGAEVDVYSVRAVTPLCSTTTKFSDSYDDAGSFVIPPECVAGDGPFIVVVKGGQDIDADKDGIIDTTPTPVFGAFHAIFSHKIAYAGNFNVSAATEAAYRNVRYVVSSAHLTDDELLSRLDRVASLILRRGGSADEKYAKYKDIVTWVPRDQQSLLQNATAVTQLENAIRKGDDVVLPASTVSGLSGSLNIGEYHFSNEIQAITAAGNLAFVIEDEVTNDTASAFRVIKIGPKVSVLGSLAITGSVVKAVLRGNTVYLTKNSNGIELVNIDNPSVPTRVWQGYLGNTIDVAFVENIVLLANGEQGLTTAELQADGSLIERSSIKLPDSAVAMSLQIVDNKAYIGASSGVFIVDVNDKGDMSILSHHKTSYPVSGVWVIGNYLYVTTHNGNEGAFMLRILSQNSQNIPNVAFEANQLLVNGSIAYVSNEYYGITLFDVSNPVKPRELFGTLSYPVRHIVAVNDVLLIVGASDVTKKGERYTGKGVLSIVASLSSLPP